MSTTTEDGVYPTTFLSMIMAYLPQGRYSVHSGKWAEIVKVLRERYEAEHPGFFVGFSIHERPPALPHSPEVSQWLTSLYMAVGALGGPVRIEAEGQVWLEFPKSFQKEERLQEKKNLQPGMTRIIQRFAREIAKEGLLAP